MSYIENNLIKGEEIVFQTRLHWWAIVGPAIYLIILGFALSICILPSSSRSGVPPIPLTLAIMITPFYVIGGYLNYQSSEFGVTNRRVIIKVGIIRRQTLELNLGKIESFEVYEPLIGRLLGYQNLVITGSGGTKQRFRFVNNANVFRKRVLELATDI